MVYVSGQVSGIEFVDVLRFSFKCILIQDIQWNTVCNAGKLSDISCKVRTSGCLGTGIGWNWRFPEMAPVIIHPKHTSFWGDSPMTTETQWIFVIYPPSGHSTYGNLDPFGLMIWLQEDWWFPFLLFARGYTTGGSMFHENRIFWGSVYSMNRK